MKNRRLITVLAALCLACTLFAQPNTTPGFKVDTVFVNALQNATETIVEITIECVGEKTRNAIASDFELTGFKAEVQKPSPMISFAPNDNRFFLKYTVKLRLDSFKAEESFKLNLESSGRMPNLLISKPSTVVTVKKTEPAYGQIPPSKLHFIKDVIFVLVDEEIKDTVVPVQFVFANTNPALHASDFIPASTNPNVKIDSSAVTQHSSGTDTVTYKVKIHLDATMQKDASFHITLPVPAKNAKLVEVTNPEVIVYVLKKERRQLVYRPILSFVTYSDFKGFRGDQPNGLVQLESNACIYFRQKRFANKKNVIFFRNMVVGFNLTKLDDKLRYKQLNYAYDSTATGMDTLIRHIHTFDLVRYSNFNAYAKLNIATINLFEAKSRIYIDGYSAIYSTGVRDSLLESDKREYNLNSTGFGLSIRFATNYRPDESFFNVSLGMTGFFITANNNNIRQRIGPLYYPENDSRNNIFTRDGIIGGKTMTIFQGEFLYSPSKDVSKNGKVFLRMNYYTNIFNRVEGTGSNSNYGNNFMQVQVGYVGSLEEFAGRFLADKPTDQPKEVQSGK